MNAPTDNQNNKKPEFDFIVNQDAGPEPKKSSNKKIIVIILLVVVAIILGIATLIASSASNVQEETVTEVPAAEIVTYQDTVNKFLQHLKSGDDEFAYGMLEDGTVVSQDDFQQDLETIWPKTQLAECVFKQATASNGDVFLLYECPYEEGSTTAVEFVFRPSDKTRIKEYVIAISGEAVNDE